MTMLGKMQVQKFLREMVEKKCEIAIVETTSEGIVQHRHRFIDYNTAVLTNLYPEHIESHGNFKRYKNAKKKLFSYTASLGKNRTAIINGDLDESGEFINYGFSKKVTFGKKSGDFTLSNVTSSKAGISFSINKRSFTSPIYGEHNAMNILCAVSIARTFGVDWGIIDKTIGELTNAPGRVEFIGEAKEEGFDVIVDYAFELKALDALYSVVDLLKPKRIIHVCGATGGGRDKSRREPIGRLVGEKADIFIITDEDPYDEDPLEIMAQVSKGAKEVGKTLNEDLFEILDRKEAIEEAISMAQKGDLVIVSGKGSEQGMCLKNDKIIPWDDRQFVRDAIKLVYGAREKN